MTVTRQVGTNGAPDSYPVGGGNAPKLLCQTPLKLEEEEEDDEDEEGGGKIA